MKCEIRTFQTSDGLVLKFRHFSDARTSPAASDDAERRVPKGIVVAVHGIQSHSGWYRDSSFAIAEAGWDVYFADRRGSGLNGKDRGHADHGDRLLNDLKQLVQLVKAEHPSCPITLLGLSWGGKLAAAFAATFPQMIQRLILMYPAIDSQIGPSPFQKILLKMARQRDIRKRLVPLPFADAGWFTSLPEFQDRISNDPLALNSVTTGLLNATEDLHRIVTRQGSQIHHPTLLMLAGNDRIVNNQKVAKRIQSWPLSDCSVICYPEAEHTLEFCGQRETFFADLTHWLNRSIPTDAV